MDRRQRLLEHIQPADQVGLEIGPLCRPVVAPDAGRIHYADHLSTEGLRQKYAQDPGVDVNAIVPIDFVWGVNGLAAAVDPLKFDYVVASHVVEHVPDLIGWLQEIGRVLRPGGLLSLAVPDHRWTFDCVRQPTSLSMVLEAHLLAWKTPALRQVLDHFLEHVSPEVAQAEPLSRGALGWDAVDQAKVDFVFHGGVLLLNQQVAALAQGAYIDAHCSVFSPHSWVALCKGLARLDLMPFKCRSFSGTQRGDGEFFVTLEKLDEALSAEQRTHQVIHSLPVVAPPLLEGEVHALQAQVAALQAQLAAQAVGPSWWRLLWARATAPWGKGRA